MVTSRICASSRKAYLAGQRKPSSISLESYASLATIAKPFSQHVVVKAEFDLVAGPAINDAADMFLVGEMHRLERAEGPPVTSASSSGGRRLEYREAG